MTLSIETLATALDDVTIAREVGDAHDEARLRFPLSSTRVKSFAEFESIIGAYYWHDFSTCLLKRGKLSERTVRSRAKRALESRLRRGEGDIVTYYRRCEAGVEGGLLGVIETLFSALKFEEVGDYVRDIMDQQIRPQMFDQKVEMIRQYFKHFGPYLSSSIDINKPEMYATNWTDVINSFVESLREQQAKMRRF